VFLFCFCLVLFLITCWLLFLLGWGLLAIVCLLACGFVFLFCFCLVLLFECLGFARAFPSRAHSPCRFLGLPLEFQSPSGPWEPALPPTSPLAFLHHIGLCRWDSPYRGGAPPILPIKRVKGGVRGGRLGLGGGRTRAWASR